MGSGMKPSPTGGQGTLSCKLIFLISLACFFAMMPGTGRALSSSLPPPVRVVSCTNQANNYKIEFPFSADGNILFPLVVVYFKDQNNWKSSPPPKFKCHLPYYEQKDLLGVCSEVIGPDAGQGIFLNYDAAKNEYSAYSEVSGPDGKKTHLDDFTCIEGNIVAE